MSDSGRHWSSLAAIAPAIVTTIAILVGVWQFNQGEVNKVRLESTLMAERQAIEHKQQLFIERLNGYRAIAESAGRIAAHGVNDEKMKEYTEDFLSKYWGLSVLVDDPPVEEAMVRFHDEVIDFRNGSSDGNRLKLRAEELNKTCRVSLEGELSRATP